jgi:CRP/FNR family transcriptional regulator
MNPDNLFSLFTFEKELMDELSDAEILEFSSGTVILKEHQFIKVIPLVLEGSIKLRKLDLTGREIVFYHIQPGESCILSITSSLNEKESQAEAIIEKRTRLLVVEASKIRSWMERFPSWRRFVFRLYYERMAELMGLLDQVIFKSVDTRLLQYLKQKAVQNEVEVTHQQLAGQLGTAREVISRLLKQMEKDQLISMERGKIKILRPL